MNYAIKLLGTVDYIDTWHNMQAFTENRNSSTPDEYWIVEHHPVFTLGLAGKEEHILYKDHNIPIIKVDRGGQVTYHGPGQIVIYTLIDLTRNNLSIRKLVMQLEQGIIDYLVLHGITASGNRDAPGVYINNKKIASIGLKVRKNCTYHGISFNAQMDTSPFNYINVCGHSGLQVIQLSDLVTIKNLNHEAHTLTSCIINAITTHAESNT